MDEQASFEPKAVLAARRPGWLVAIVPALALAAIAWVGLTGPGSSAESATQPSNAPVAVASSAPAASVPRIAPRRDDSGFPPTVLGLDVQALDDLQRYPPRDDVTIALAGWYAAASASACPAATDLQAPGFIAELGVDARAATFCQRSGRLFASSPEAGTQGGVTDPAMTVVMTPGVVLPPALDDIGGDATRVVFVGRLELERRCVTCLRQAGFVWQLHVDRVVWAAGLGRAQTTSILPRLLDPGPVVFWRLRDRVADAAIGPTGAILMETLVDPETLAAVDPAAADVVSPTAPTADRIWYRRALAPDPAREAPRWVAIDDATGKVIGSGSIGLAAGG